MKLSALFIPALLVYSLAACQSDSKFIRADESEIDKASLEFATSISRKILTAQKEESFYALSEEEATETMVTGMNESLQKQSYRSIKSAFGEYQDIRFDHMMKSTDGTLYKIYRFKGKFNPEVEVEVRTVLDAENELAGFFVKPWKDEL